MIARTLSLILVLSVLVPVAGAGQAMASHDVTVEPNCTWAEWYLIVTEQIILSVDVPTDCEPDANVSPPDAEVTCITEERYVTVGGHTVARYPYPTSCGAEVS